MLTILVAAAAIYSWHNLCVKKEIAADMALKSVFIFGLFIQILFFMAQITALSFGQVVVSQSFSRYFTTYILLTLLLITVYGVLQASQRSRERRG